ncbi:MAG: 50S ribosomal protein L10 [Dehalococcoidia bacterium]|nr:50S ribosomal protein L10 [Dehalococcoidia bacterium]
MRKEKKAQNIDRLQQEFAKSTIGILTDYRGLKTLEMNGLRRKLQETGGDYKVVKNTLAVKAAERLNRPQVKDIFAGPVAIAFGYGDVTNTAKVFTDYVRTSKINIGVKGGFMGDTVLTGEDIGVLATLPPKPVLVARVLGGLKSPLYSLVGVLAAPMRNFQGVLQARIKQLEETK